MANIDGKYKISIGIEYEIKSTSTELICLLPKKSIDKRTKQLKKFTKHISKLKSQGWDISITGVISE